MAQFSIGPSSYGDLKGVTQFVNSERIAKQFRSMAADYKNKFGQNGDTLSANEGMRSRPRQDLLYRQFLANGYPVAAVPYNSRHDAVLHGNAIDVGVTRKDGSNRALTDAEFAWMHSEAEQRGFTWTGRNFGEPWHIEGATRPEIKGPYSDDILYGGGTKPSKPPVPKTVETDEYMKITYYEKNDGRIIGVLWGPLGSWVIGDINGMKGDKVRDLLRRWILSDQSKAVPETFNEVEFETLRAAFGKVQ